MAGVHECGEKSQSRDKYNKDGESHPSATPRYPGDEVAKVAAVNTATKRNAHEHKI